MLELTGDRLTIHDVISVARNRDVVAPLSKDVRAKMEISRDWIKQAVDSGQQTIYGVNTGFGPLATTRIPKEQTRSLSRKVILNCLSGVGDPIPLDVVRALMLIRANTLVKGYSGIRPEVVETLLEMLNANLIPWVPSKGSLGASGDLIPLAHIAVVLTKAPDNLEDDASGQAWYHGELMRGDQAMEKAGLQRHVLEAKEGLALTNGTSMMGGFAALGIYDGMNLVRHAEIAAALSMEALLALSSPLSAELQVINNQPGQIVTANNLRRVLSGSDLIDSDEERVQDAYSIRCTPQVYGPIRDMIDFIEGRVTAAINAATDNPLVFVDPENPENGRAISGGNFHGEGLALWLDTLGLSLAEIGGLSERRVFRLITPELNAGLPAMLVETAGLDSGLMMPQYTAAALVSENKTLAHPDSVDSIPSSGNQEDHVSMGANSALHTYEIIENVFQIVAIELLTASQAIDLRPSGPDRLGIGTAAAYRVIRDHVTFLDHDRETSSDIETLVNLIRQERILDRVQEVIGDRLD